ncbi:MAG TPA: hypothetical protein DCY03_15260 [Planctomycetaceae bacterium]|nr:hypothetical protein [Planctomycetaceae bacterium]
MIDTATDVLREVFRNNLALTEFLKTGKVSTSGLSLGIYVNYWRRRTHVADHTLRPRLDREMAEISSPEKHISHALSSLSDHFLERQPATRGLDNRKNIGSGRIFRHTVRWELFEDWQNTITDILPLFVIAWRLRFGRNLLRMSAMDVAGFITNEIEPQLRFSALPTTHNPYLSSLIEQHGLDEMHLHLNGTSESELVWRDAIMYPIEFAKKIRKPDADERREELFAQEDPSLTTEELILKIKAASRLRSALWQIIRRELGRSSQDRNADNQQILAKARYDILCSDDITLAAGREFDHPPFKHFNNKPPLIKETLFLCFLYSMLEATKDKRLQSAIYSYLQLQALFHRVIVQQEHQLGFDQFQKITVNELRERTEERYKARFHQLQYSQIGDIDCLEGRFSPKKDLPGNRKLLTQIISDFARYKKQDGPSIPRGLRNLASTAKALNTGRMRLSLVAHFIKKPDKMVRKLKASKNVVSFWQCRHYSLRCDVEKQRRTLENLLNTCPDLNHFVSGFDAAANELDAPPEVFAPVFRRLRTSGHRNFTYHCGEDFRHLLTGMRAVEEAVDFLKLGAGCRIGHGTAVGIDPKLWIDRSPPSITMPAGTRLDDLVFVRKHLAGSADNTPILAVIDSKIAHLSMQIYGGAYPYEILYEAWKLRWIDPILVFEIDSKLSDALTGERRREVKQFRKKKAEHPEAFKLFERYHGARGNSDTVSKYETLIDIDKADPVERMLGREQYRKIQTAIIRLINTKQMAIEVLPTSNLRIAPYHSYAEHHVLTWLGVKPESGMQTTVCIGSDDPGIFATNLRNEYAHLFREIDNINSMTTATHSVDFVLKLIENGKIFRFRD